VTSVVEPDHAHACPGAGAGGRPPSGDEHRALTEQTREFRNDHLVERRRAKGHHGVHRHVAVVRCGSDQLTDLFEQLSCGVRVGGGELLELVHHEHQAGAGLIGCLQRDLQGLGRPASR
jgi:hypothetical protein